jgi:hypothetical protein
MNFVLDWILFDQVQFPLSGGSSHYAGIQLNPSHTLGTAKQVCHAPCPLNGSSDGLHSLHLPAFHLVAPVPF